MARTLPTALTIAALLAASPASAQGASDHLLVYKIRASPAIAVDYSMDLGAATPELAALGCVLRADSRAGHLLVPVDKRNVSPPPPNPQIRGRGLETDFVCYKVECPLTDTTVRLTRRNQFMSHDVRRARVRRVCVPSEVSAPPTTMPTCSREGESCAAGEPCCGELSCCAGIPVPAGQEFCGAVCPISDRERKENFAHVDASQILDKLAGLQITAWNYKAEAAGIRHLGPMAQDFHAAFGLGSADDSIFLVDADGVALTAIQALYQEVESLRRQNQALRRSLESIETRLVELE